MTCLPIVVTAGSRTHYARSLAALQRDALRSLPEGTPETTGKSLCGYWPYGALSWDRRPIREVGPSAEPVTCGQCLGIAATYPDRVAVVAANAGLWAS